MQELNKILFLESGFCGNSLVDLPEDGMHQLLKLQRNFLQAVVTSANQGCCTFLSIVLKDH